MLALLLLLLLLLLLRLEEEEEDPRSSALGTVFAFFDGSLFPPAFRVPPVTLGGSAFDFPPSAVALSRELQ